MRRRHAPNRDRGLIELVILVILITAALLLFLPYDHPTDTFPSLSWPAHYPGTKTETATETGTETNSLVIAVENAKRHAAEIHARRFLNMLGSDMGLAIKIESKAEMPTLGDGRKVIAHATRGWAGMCVIHLTPGAAEMVEVIAH